MTGTMSSGKAGDITINATDNITIFSNTGLTALLAGTTSSGGGGNISLFTTDFNLSATNSNLPYPIAVATSSLGEGVAGDINIVATGNFNANNGLVSASPNNPVEVILTSMLETSACGITAISVLIYQVVMVKAVIFPSQQISSSL